MGTFWATTPMRPWARRPSRMRREATYCGRAHGDGEAEALGRRHDRPCSCPRPRRPRSTSGPPELPGFRAASVWMRLSIRRPGLRAQRAPQGAHHAGRDRRLKAEGAADGHDELADLQGARVAQPGGHEVGGVDAHDGHVGPGVVAHDLRRGGAAVGEGHLDGRLAPCTTWLLVMTKPSGVKTKPEPLPAGTSAKASSPAPARGGVRARLSRRRTSMFTTDGLTWRAAAMTARE